MVQWRGVFPAVTTPFRRDLSIDFDFLRRHVAWLIDHGCKGIVPARTSSDIRQTSLPIADTAPPHGRSRPESTARSVDLPLPDGPMSRFISPW